VMLILSSAERAQRLEFCWYALGITPTGFYCVSEIVVSRKTIVFVLENGGYNDWNCLANGNVSGVAAALIAQMNRHRKNLRHSYRFSFLRLLGNHSIFESSHRGLSTCRFGQAHGGDHVLFALPDPLLDVKDSTDFFPEHPSLSGPLASISAQEDRIQEIWRKV
jgi:hypothetical protein